MPRPGRAHPLPRNEPPPFADQCTRLLKVRVDAARGLRREPALLDGPRLDLVRAAREEVDQLNTPPPRPPREKETENPSRVPPATERDRERE